MKGLIKQKIMILKIVGFILFFQTTLFANPSYTEGNYIKSTYEYKNISSSKTIKNSSDKIEISLNSFGSASIVIVLVLTSLLGMFFVRNEFDELVE